MPTIAVGVDIGQKRDPTAIAVVEPEFRDVNGRREDYYLVRFLERQPALRMVPDRRRLLRPGPGRRWRRPGAARATVAAQDHARARTATAR
jgi:hypothetical protein